jgi:CspA family cold shock protein
MAVGTVLEFIEERGFGFIRPTSGGADIVVHARSLVGVSVLKKNQHVSFEVTANRRRIGKPRAEKVRVIEWPQ